MTPAQPFASGTWYWDKAADGARLIVRLIWNPGDRIEVGIFCDRLAGHGDVQLIFGLYRNSVELGSLRGNGFNAPQRHQAGFGTLAVNVAIQALKVACNPRMPIDGVLSNTDEFGLPADRRAVLDEQRRGFWRRFGLDVVSSADAGMDYLHGRVEHLVTVNHGLVAGRFTRCPGLDAFSRQLPD